MDTITLDWKGPCRLYQIEFTPSELYGLKGVFAITHNSKIIYIGKAHTGKGIFREAKEGREWRYVMCLVKLNLIPKEFKYDKSKYMKSLKEFNLMIDKLDDTDFRLEKYMEENVQLYAGIASPNEYPMIQNCEYCLIYKIKPKCNKQGLKHYIGDASIEIINKGNFPPELSSKEQCLKKL